MNTVQQLLAEFEHDIETLSLTPSRGGVHEYTVDGDLVFSKKDLGRHPEPDEIIEAVRSRT